MVAVLFALAVAVSACGSQPSKPSLAFPSSVPASQDSGPLTILTFAGSDDPRFDKTFKAEYPNAQLNYVHGDSNEDFFSKVKAGGVQPDIVYAACVNLFPDWMSSGLIAPIDTSRLTNWKDLNPDVEKLGVINGVQWGAVAYYGYDSIIAETNGPVPPPTSWKDLWNSQYKNQFSMINYAENGIQMAAVAWGLPYPNLSDAQLATVKQHLLDLRSNNIKTFWTAYADPMQQIANKEVSLFYGWPSQYAAVVAAGTPATYVNEKEGRLNWSCGALVMKNTKHYDLALKWIDARLSPEEQAQEANIELSGIPNVKGLSLADQKIINQMGYDDPAIFKASHAEVALTPTQRLKFNQVWQAVVAGS
jgi:spermidine/putrescine-binding protein